MQVKDLIQRKRKEAALVLLKKELSKRKAKSEFMHFVQYIVPEYKAKTVHKSICRELQGIYEYLKTGQGKKRLIINVPPQHGKSFLASHLWPAWLYGHFPHLKIGGISYNEDLAKEFSRAIMNTILSPEYKQLFPGTGLAGKGITKSSLEKHTFTAKRFDVTSQSQTGKYMATGVGGALTGRSLDVAILDDPYKNPGEANSPAHRKKVKLWWDSVVETRLNNNSVVLIIMNRWHEEDLVAELLKTKDANTRFALVKYPAIQDREPSEQDPRQIGEALFPELHSKEKLLNFKQQNPKVFNAQYQQRPEINSGTLFGAENYNIIDWQDVPFDPAEKTWHFVIDTAETKNKKNDETGVSCYTRHNGILYYRRFLYYRLEFTDLWKNLIKDLPANGLTRQSKVWIEPKSSGRSLYSTLQDQTNWIVKLIKLAKIKGKDPMSMDKIARASLALPHYESRPFQIIKGKETAHTIEQLSLFPTGEHDEAVDITVYPALIEYYATKGKATGMSRNRKPKPVKWAQ